MCCGSIMPQIVANMIARVREVIQGRGCESRERGIREQRVRIVQKRHFARFCYYYSLLIIAQSKHKKKLVHSCPPGHWATEAVANSGPPVLHPWLNLSILIEEIQTLLTTHQRIYSRAHAGTSTVGRNGFCLIFTSIG